MTDAEPTSGWARLWATARPFARPTPRAGAWYPVVGEASSGRVVLEVRGRRVAVQRRFLEIRPDRPNVFTVVVRTRGSVRMTERGEGAQGERVYAVCPYCTTRVRVLQDQPAVTCSRCGHRGAVAWWETG